MEAIDPQITSNIALVMIVAAAIGRAVPDNATGVLGLLRKIAKIIGIYSPNNK